MNRTSFVSALKFFFIIWGFMVFIFGFEPIAYSAFGSKLISFLIFFVGLLVTAIAIHTPQNRKLWSAQTSRIVRWCLIVLGIYSLIAWFTPGSFYSQWFPVTPPLGFIVGMPIIALILVLYPGYEEIPFPPTDKEVSKRLKQIRR